jgi:hypothetical protein
MTHLTSTELHDIGYGMGRPTPHLDECADCRRTLELVQKERGSLRGILAAKGSEPVLRARGVAAAPQRRWISVAGLAAGGLGLVFTMILVFTTPQGSSPAGQAENQTPEQVFQAIEKRILKASTFRVRFVRESIDLAEGNRPERLSPFDSGVLYLKEGNQVSFTLRIPPDQPGGLETENLMISDGKRAMGLVREGGSSRLDTTGEAFEGLREKLAVRFCRGGIHLVTNVLRPGSPPEAPKSFLWKGEVATGFRFDKDDGDAKTLTYRLQGGQTVKLWYNPKTLALLKRRIEDKGHDSFLETYTECAIDDPTPEGEFTFPPGQEESVGVLISTEEYLSLKAKNKIREVWIKPQDLTADLLEPIERQGKMHRKVRVFLEPEFQGPGKNAKLYVGLDAERVHRTDAKK